MATGGRQRAESACACTPDGWPASRSAGRMLHSWTLRDLLDSGVTVRVGEAVAIVQRLMHDDPGAFDATSPYGPLTLHNV